MFKVNNKDTRETSMMPYTVDFEQVNVWWDERRLRIIRNEKISQFEILSKKKDKSSSMYSCSLQDIAAEKFKIVKVLSLALS